MSSIFVGFLRKQQYSRWFLANNFYKVSIVGRALVLKALNTHEATDLARDTFVPVWGLQNRSEDVITPKSLTVSVAYNVMPLDVKYEKSSLICGSSYSVELLKEDWPCYTLLPLLRTRIVCSGLPDGKSA